jgi:ABC-type siderophore export system fused ATPase/permease subunit
MWASIIAALRKQLGEKVLAAPIEQIERTAAIG